MTMEQLDKNVSLASFSGADIELLGKAVRQVMTAHPELNIVHSGILVGAALILGQVATDTHAESIVSDVSIGIRGDWRIELTKIEGLQ